VALISKVARMCASPPVTPEANVAGDDVERDPAGLPDVVVDRLGADVGAHGLRTAQGAERFGGILGRDLAAREAVQDGAALAGIVVADWIGGIGLDRLLGCGLDAIGQAEGAQEA
jgi:hypothetical protein